MIIDQADKARILAQMNSSAVGILERKSRSKICLYGPNGGGKTTLAVALARKMIGPAPTDGTYDIIFVDTNEGFESLKNHPPLVPGVLVLTYDSVAQLYVIAEAIYNRQGKFANAKAVILDDADFMADRELKALWHNRVENKRDSKLDPEKPERPEYLKLVHRFTEVMDYLANNTPDVHLIMTAHEGEKKTESGVVLKVFPGFNPALAGEIADRMLVLAHITAKEIKVQDGQPAQYVRQAQVHPTFNVDAKSRIYFETVKYEISAFMQHVYNWYVSGAAPEREVEAVRRDMETSKVSDDVFGPETLADDDAPIVVQ